MTTILLIAQFALAAIIVLVVLLQKSSSIGLGAYSGSNESLFGSRGPNAFLAKTTALFGVLLVANSIALTYLYYADRDSSVTDRVTIPVNLEANASEPIAPDLPESNAPIIPLAPKE
ncbi:MAG: preprotein translocase subunit SecG [Helicobacteraceae bacterium]|jgi:preprotein translocase subunit SecG|nr:preprotein translocase subunit SecG [Helicobacteraceae bacterium]